MWPICLLIIGNSERINRATIVSDSTRDFHLDLERYFIMHRYPLLSFYIVIYHYSHVNHADIEIPNKGMTGEYKLRITILRGEDHQ